jgi:hypothetical protein
LKEEEYIPMKRGGVFQSFTQPSSVKGYITAKRGGAFKWSLIQASTPYRNYNSDKIRNA